MTNWYIRGRYVLFRIIVIAAVVLVSAKLWDLQIVSSQSYQTEANANRFRLVQIDAPRGVIYDSAGRLLVRNVPSFSVMVTPGALPEDTEQREQVLQKLGDYLGIPVHETALDSIIYSSSSEGAEPLAINSQRTKTIDDIMNTQYNGEWTAVRIASNVPRDIAFIIEETQTQMPGVSVVAEPIREYLEGELMSHILGYEGRIPADELEAYQAQTELKYQPDDLVGLTGIEATQESVLRGTAGQKHIEVDAYEHEVAVLAEDEPVPGANVRLTIDVELQRAVEDILRDGMKRANSDVGVAVLLDPNTGKLLSSVSLPSFDNNKFSGGISYDEYYQLSSDPNHPMIDHAISGQYPPGSTFKVIPAAAALQEGIITLGTTVNCQGTIKVPNKYFPDDPTLAQTFYCWQTWGHGNVNVTEALQGSCDIFFYTVGGGTNDFEGLGIDRLDEYMKMFGFGSPTGIELTGESKGLVPTPKWKVQNYGESWALGDTYNASIGQGFDLVTPLQLVNATAAIANGGTLYQPQVVEEITDADGHVIQAFQPKVIRELAIDKDILAYVRAAMRDTVANGTARYAQIPGIEVAGKTGSAEYAVWDANGDLVRDEFGHLPTHAWFIAFAPYENPEVAVVVFLEGGGTGAEMAAPVVANILRYYFGLPTVDLSDPTRQIID
ncbi:MAG: penicillin-binding protein 2 [Chloroflexi bacterium]|nr:penicillin-binding protein 2 [Chloroflexota bacterium]